MGWADAAAGADQDAEQAAAPTQTQAPTAGTPSATPSRTSAPSESNPTSAPPSAPGGYTNELGDQVAAPPEPPVVTSTKPGGIMGLVNSLRDALSGKTRPEIGTDQYGQAYVKQVTPSGGAKWAKIAAQAAVGAARGFAAGRGNNPGAAVAAGVDQGAKFADQRQQQQQDMSVEARQQNLERANNQLLTQKIAEQAMAAKRLGLQGTREAIEFSEHQQDWMAARAEGNAPVEYTDQAGNPTTTVSNVKDAAQMMIQTPGFHENHIQQGLMQPVQLYDKDGKANGFAVYQMKAGTNEEMLPAGQTVYHYDGVNDKLVPQQTSQPMKAMDVLTTNNAAKAAQNEAHLKAEDLKNKQADTASKLAEVPLKKSETAKNLEALNKLKNPAPDDPGVAALGEQVAKGGLTEDTITGMSKGTRAAVESYLAQHHPNLDQKSVFITGGERKQADLAGNALHNLNTIDATLQRRPDLLGVINGRISQGKELTGTNDPDLAALDTELDNYALASTGAHGIRAVQARAHAKKALLNGFKNGPQGVQASLGAARMSLQNLSSVGSPRGINGQPYVYNAQQGGGSAGGPPAIIAGTPPPAAGMKRIWAPGSPVWRDIPEAQVPKNIQGLVVQ